MNRLLIDTIIYSGALKGDADIVRVLRKVSHIGITAISIGELLSGFKAGNRERENREELAIFLDSPRVTPHSTPHSAVTKLNFLGSSRISGKSP